MSEELGQLGRSLEDDKDLYPFPSGELKASDFYRDMLPGKDITKIDHFVFRLISPIEFRVKTYKYCKKLEKFVKDPKISPRLKCKEESKQNQFVFSVKHYFHILSRIKKYSDINANYNQLDVHLIQTLKTNLNRNDSIITFIKSDEEGKRQLIESLNMDSKYKKIMEMMTKNFLLVSLKKNQLIAFYMSVIREGKCILADIKGATLSAITAMTYFRDDWPLAVVCATNRKEYWINKLMDWEGHHYFRINAVSSEKDIYQYPQPFHDIMIMDYDLYYSVKDTLSFLCLNLKAYIFEDQTRGIPSEDIPHNCRPFKGLSKVFDNGHSNLKNAKRIIFIWASEFELSQTNRKYIWPLLTILDPKAYNDNYFDKFDEKYIESNESNNIQELQIILRSSFLIKNSNYDYN